MKTITKYQARDGREFNNKIDCKNHEDLLLEIDKVNSILRAAPDTCDFANGSGYIQHSISQIVQYKDKLDELLKRTIKGFNFTDKTHISYVLRVTGDCNSPLYGCYQRLYCVDWITGREWGQPYFALNPQKGKQICLN